MNCHRAVGRGEYQSVTQEDRGFTYPELNAYALRKLRPQIEAAGVSIGYSNSRTCEIGLTTNSGIPYVSIVYLVDECTQPATVKLNN